MFVKWLSLILIFSSGCSLFQARQSERLDFFTGLGPDSPVTSEEIKKNLAKTTSNAGGFYQIQVMPLTRPYLRALRHEQAIMRGLTPRELAEMEIQDELTYLDQKLCVEISAAITRHQAATDLHSWNVVLEDNEGVPRLMNWISQEPEIVQSKVMGPHGEDDSWLVSSKACSVEEFMITPQFSVKLSPSFTPWPFPAQMSTTWQFYDSKKEAKEKSPNFRRYRGY
jgi:hypothetical protein